MTDALSKRQNLFSIAHPVVFLSLALLLLFTLPRPPPLQVAAELAKFDAEPLLYVGHAVLVNLSSVAGSWDKKHNDWKGRFNSTLQVCTRHRESSRCCFCTCRVESSAQASARKPALEVICLTSDTLLPCRMFSCALCEQDCRGIYYTPYLVDRTGAAKVEDYAFGPLASIKDGRILEDRGAYALSGAGIRGAAAKAAPAVATSDAAPVAATVASPAPILAAIPAASPPTASPAAMIPATAPATLLAPASIVAAHTALPSAIPAAAIVTPAPLAASPARNDTTLAPMATSVHGYDISCKQSDMCSIGKSKVYYGTVRTSKSWGPLPWVRPGNSLAPSPAFTQHFSHDVNVHTYAGTYACMHAHSSVGGFRGQTLSLGDHGQGGHSQTALSQPLVRSAGNGFKAALEAVSYKRELILVTTYGSHYLEFVFQLRSQFKRLGLDHFMALSMFVSTAMNHL